jgi:hypothetical protein
MELCGCDDSNNVYFLYPTDYYRTLYLILAGTARGWFWSVLECPHANTKSQGMAHHLKQLPVCNAHSSYVFEVDVNSNSRDHAMSLSDDTFQHGIFSSLSLMDLIIFPLLTWQ